MAQGCITRGMRDGNERAICPKPPLPGLDVCGWHQVRGDGTPDDEAIAAFTAENNSKAGKARAHQRHPRAPSADELLDTRERVISYLSRYKTSPKFANAAARIASAALQALNTPELKALEAENERLRRIIEKYLPQAKPLLAELRAVK